MTLLVGKRELLARALGKPQLQPLSRALGTPGLLVLTYHRVCDFSGLDDGVVSATVEEFEWQVSFIKKAIRILSGPELVRLAAGELRLREPALCITFDDGYTDNIDAGRVLARHGVPAIFFVTTGFVGTDTITHWDRIAYAIKRTDLHELAIPAFAGKGPWTVKVTPRDVAAREMRTIYLSLRADARADFIDTVERAAAAAAASDASRKHPPFMRWDDVRELRDLGHTIGSHTHSHPILAHTPLAEQERELALSRETIARELGGPPKLLAYPNGREWAFSDETKEAARQAGFVAAFSFYGGRNPPTGFDPFDLRRVWVSPSESRDLFRARVGFPQLLA